MTAPDLDTDKLAVLLAVSSTGPWIMETVRTSCGTCHKVGTFPSTRGDTTYACIYDDYPPGIGRPENLANAALISLAPDLAREVIRLRAFVEEVRDYKPSVISGRAHDPQDDVDDMMPLGEFESFQYDAVDLVGKKVTK